MTYGVSIVVVDRDGECYAEGFGARDLETNAPATPDTLCAVGSITKPVTALAIMQLAEEGSLSMDDPVNAYVDHYAEAPGSRLRSASCSRTPLGCQPVTPG